MKHNLVTTADTILNYLFDYEGEAIPEEITKKLTDTYLSIVKWESSTGENILPEKISEFFKAYKEEESEEEELELTTYCFIGFLNQ